MARTRPARPPCASCLPADRRRGRACKSGRTAWRGFSRPGRSCMKASVPQALMVLAVNLLGESRSDWGQAIQVEFEVARAEGEGLAFASGCVLAAWGEMLKHPEGRHVLADYAFALGLLIPMAAFQFASAFGLASTIEGPLSEAIFLPKAASNPFVSYPQVSALTCLLVLWLLLGLSHVRLAWVLVERDWARVKIGRAHV